MHQPDGCGTGSCCITPTCSIYRLPGLLSCCNSSTSCTWTLQSLTHDSLFTQFSLLPLLTRDLSNNSLTGTLPPSWSGLQDLEALRLDANALRGPLPSRWAALASLQELTAQSNMLTGTYRYKYIVFRKWVRLRPRHQLGLHG